MDITAVRKAMAAQVASVIPAPLTVLWYVPDGPTEPILYFKPVALNYDRAMRHGLEQVDFEGALLVSRADDLSSQVNLDAYIHGTGALSVKAALEAGRTQLGGSGFGGVLDDLWVSHVDAYQYYLMGDTRFLGATFHITVIGSGNV